MHESMEACTVLGGRHLASGKLKAALDAFKKAYFMAKKNGTKEEIQQTMLNLGAAYIAVRKFNEGIKILKSVLVSETNLESIKPFDGDLLYNLGLACELQGNGLEAIQYFEKAVKKYHARQEDETAVARVACHLGRLYARHENFCKAAEAYDIAAMAYEFAGEHEQQVICLCHKASLVEMDNNRQEDATAVASRCVILCQSIPQTGSTGRLYNELGLLFAKCQKLSQAEACFNLALPLLSKDLKSTAVIQQNLGAVYNCLGDYHTSLRHHEMAAELYARSGSRNGQGQCFSNLAYAYSQLGDMESASEYYLHALQAAKDTRDRNDRWQALEGLGAIAFRLEKLDRAVSYFQKALAALNDSDEESQSRIIAKLSQVLELQLTLKKRDKSNRPAAEKTKEENLEPLNKKSPQTLLETYNLPKKAVTPKANKSPSVERSSSTNPISGYDCTDAKLPDQNPNVRPESLSTLSTKRRKDEILMSSNHGKEGAAGNQLIMNYQKKLEKTENDDSEISTDDDSGTDDDDDDNTTTENEQHQPASSAPKWPAPHAPQSSSQQQQPMLGTYMNPLPYDTNNSDMNKTAATIKDDPDYSTILPKDSSAANPPLPPRIHHQSNPYMSGIANSRNESEMKRTQKPMPAPRQKSRACSIM